MDAIRRWWRQPDRYEWLSEYLEAQHLRWPLQVIMAISVTVLGCVPILLLWSPAMSPFVATAAVALPATALCWTMTFVWLTRWPSRRTSRAFAVLSALCVSAACLIALQPQQGLTSCVVFVVIAGLVAFTHTSPFLILVLGIAVSTTIVCGLRAATGGDPILAASETLLVLVSILTVPMVGQVLIQLLGADAVNSDVDALTGLHNRRGFHRAVGDRTSRPVRRRGALGVVMVDLDEFKRVNDTQGHAAGDRVLTSVAAVLRRVAGTDVVVARIGGEEFCIAARMSDNHLRHLADRVRAAIAGLPHSVTASVGTASAPGHPATRTLDELLSAADQAMYAAKRAGGNRVCHASDLPAERPEKAV
ncbi:GGDEF domain-containing protein [Mycobacterium sp. AMU20-3851]|uniref:GGDEF domain-containing protein n=1 Tax=Mycobacterium sp. AMU20-3851 TaxID=3122055 RepID=UPI003754FC39